MIQSPKISFFIRLIELAEKGFKKFGNFYKGFDRAKLFDCQVPLSIKYSSYIIELIHITPLKERNFPNIYENRNTFVIE